MERPVPRKRGRALDRNQVVLAALALVNEEGPEACGVNRVARDLGIKPPSLYNHVGGNSDLRMAVAVEGYEQLRASTLRAEKRSSQLETLAHGYRAWAKANAGLYRLMSTTSLDPTDREYAPVLERGLKPYTDAMADLGLDDEDAIHGIRTLRATLHGFILLELDGQFRLGQDADESFRRCVATMLRGLTS